MKKKTLIGLIAAALVICLAVGGTVAYLHQTASVKNVFTSGNVGVTMAETKGTAQPDGSRTFSVLPGDKVAKDPKITVKKGSEACYLFFELVGSTNWTTYINEPAAAAGWTKLAGTTNTVYYRTVTKAAVASADATFQALAGEGSGDLKDGFVQMTTTFDEVAAADAPLSLTVYTGAIQQSNLATAAAAWTALTNNTGTLVPASN